MAKADNPPKGQCRQCWRHAHDKSIHKKLKPRENCGPCVEHMKNGHAGMIVT
jgi:hypothetical protein